METNNSTNLKKYLPFILGAVVFVIGFFATQHFLSSSEAHNISTQESLTSAAVEINKNCPMMVEENTRLENVMSLPNNEFQLSHTLVNVSLTDVSDSLESMRANLTSDLINNVQSNPDFDVFKENKTTLVCYYNDRDGSAILEITITPDLYQ